MHEIIFADRRSQRFAVFRQRHPKAISHFGAGQRLSNSQKWTLSIQSTDSTIQPILEESMAKAAGKTKANSGFMKPMQPSEHLAKIVGTQPLPRSEVTKKIWAHIKKNKLQNPKNKREIFADEKLQPIFGGKKLDMFQMTKAVNKHLK
jgi:upstream activation factor subunit UAF30